MQDFRLQLSQIVLFAKAVMLRLVYSSELPKLCVLECMLSLGRSHIYIYERINESIINNSPAIWYWAKQ